MSGRRASRYSGTRLGFGCGTALVLVGLLAAVSAHAQPPANIARIGYLGDDPVAGAHLRGAFLQGLRDLGYVEGRNVVIEYRFVQGKHERFGALADELVALKVDVIVVGLIRSALAAKSRLPAVYSVSEFVDAGGLMAYGADMAGMYRRAATYVDRILKGTQPADLPVEQPTKFDLVINLKAAKALGLTIPPSLLVRAARVVGK